MNEEAARRWLTDRLGVSRETLEQIDCFVALLAEEAGEQNLISASTWPTIWERHIVDSAQLLLLAPTRAGSWIDLGTGAGFPGIIVALISQVKMHLIDSRRKRADFLAAAVDRMGLGGRVTVQCARVEAALPKTYDVISARAFAPLERLFSLGGRFAGPDTVWLLPKGRGAVSELAEARRSWQGEFQAVSSVTDPEAAIIIARGVQAKGKS